MQKIAIIQISEAGADAAQQIRQATAGEVISRADVPARWHDFDAFVFIGAMGICVRTIAPLVEDKHSDPAVLCLDTLGQHVIPVLSGHIGGANALAEALAVQLGAGAVITTQSDLAGLWALDTLGQRFGWHKLASPDENRVIFAFVGCRPVALVLGVRDEAPTISSPPALRTSPSSMKPTGAMSVPTASRPSSSSPTATSTAPPAFLAFITSPRCLP